MALSLDEERVAKAAQYMGVMDLTSLNDNDTEDSIRTLCTKAQSALASVAAVCVYPRFVQTAVEALKGTTVDVATVINFPNGDKSADECRQEIQTAVANGATEVDFVINWRQFNENGLTQEGATKLKNYVTAMVISCGTARSKVIIESGELKSDQLIKLASEISLDAGVNFLKTSTGKVPTGATLSAAKIMMETIKEKKLPNTGFKASGGIRTFEDAQKYSALAEQIMGPQFVAKPTFRFGASGLRDALLLAASNNTEPTGNVISAY